MAERILLIEDDPVLATGLVDALEFEGFQVEHARTGRDGLAALREKRPDCVVLDLMLPDTNGYKVCETIRIGDPVVPILMLTARSQEADKIRGLESGADDYVTKPFSVGELIARIRAIFRRTQRTAVSETIALGDASIDVSAQILSRGSTRVPLSFYEVQLLRYLNERRGQVVSRDELLDRIWGIDGSHNNRTVDNFVVKLRKKVEVSADKPQHILTIYGHGYKLV